MAHYEMSSNPPDSWDLAKTVTLVGTLVSILSLLVSSDAKSRKTISTIGTYLSAARALVHFAEPPRCQICGA